MFPNKMMNGNQTCHIHGQLYTLISRLGHGTYGAVWKSITPNGKILFSSFVLLILGGQQGD